LLKAKSTSTPTSEFSFSPSPSLGSLITTKPLGIFSGEGNQNHSERPRWIETSVGPSPSPTSTSNASTLVDILVPSEETTQSQLELPRWSFILVAVLACISFLVAVFVIIYLLLEARKKRKEKKDFLWTVHGLKYVEEVFERGGGTMYL
jgi:hypothetical protein